MQKWSDFTAHMISIRNRGGSRAGGILDQPLRNTKYCMLEEFQTISQWICLRRDMLKALMALSSSPKSIIVKTDNQFNRYVSNFTHNQNFAFVSKETYLIFAVKEFSFYIWFKKRARFKLVFCSSNKIVSYRWTSYRYPEPTFA